jgi:hypothetical protein
MNEEPEWWDLVAHDFWSDPKLNIPGTYKSDPSKLHGPSRGLLDVLFATLGRIIAFNSSKESASLKVE